MSVEQLLKEFQDERERQLRISSGTSSFQDRHGTLTAAFLFVVGMPLVLLAVVAAMAVTGLLLR